MGIELDDTSRLALVEYRMQRAHETYNDALVALENNSLSTSMNRLYYSCFYTVLELLVQKGLFAKSHDGVKKMFGINFIATNIFDRKYSRYYSQILQASIQSDYDDFFMFDRDTCECLMKEGKEFIDEIESYIRR